MSTLLVLSLGPVQEFIAAARKTRDLWFGSQLLAETALAAAKALQDAGGQLIFPDPESLTLSAAPNKILAIVDGDPAALAALAFEAALARLREHAAEARRTAKQRGVESLVDWGLYDEQIDAFLERYAAWYPYDPAQPASYQGARQAAERALAGRKALRDFVPAAGRDGVPKSSLDGGREAVLRIRDREPGRSEDTVRLSRADIKAGELLDGVSLLKRLADTQRFVSVSRVAIDPAIRGTDGEARLAELRTIADRLVAAGSTLVQRFDARAFPQYATFPCDTQLFYNDGSGEEGESEATLSDGAAFFRAARALITREPPAYLAVLVADGDRMGRAIAHLDSPDAHRALSRAGATFAERADRVVRGHAGALIYSGGDDVLALLPLDTAIGCAAALRNAFVEAMKSLPLPADLVPTLSVGLAIGHYNEPLGTLLGWGREAERLAKRGRNALAVALHTRSGGSDQAVAVAPWSDAPLTNWERWVTWYVEDIVPDGAAYELRGLARELRGLRDRGAMPARMLEPEVTRILTRKRGGRGTRNLGKEEIERIIAMLPGTGDEVERLETMVSTMIIARHIARAHETAQGAHGEVAHAGR